MNRIRKVVIALAIICMVALGAFALVGKSRSKPEPQGGDVIIIKGGSLEVTCPQGDECLGRADSKGKYKHKKDTSHITQVVVRDINSGEVLYTGTYAAGNQPQIEITYK